MLKIHIEDGTLTPHTAMFSFNITFSLNYTLNGENLNEFSLKKHKIKSYLGSIKAKWMHHFPNVNEFLGSMWTVNDISCHGQWYYYSHCFWVVPFDWLPDGNTLVIIVTRLFSKFFI